MEKINILFFYILGKGGGTSAVIKLKEGLERLGKYSCMEIGKDVNSIDYDNYDSLLIRIIENELISKNRKSQNNALFSVDGAGIDITKYMEIRNTDIIHIHWCQYLLNPFNIAQLTSLNKKIFITLHDSRFFTGGCHVPLKCKRYNFYCNDCEQIYENMHWLPPLDIKMRYEIFKDLDITFISPSRWLAEKASKSIILKNKKIVIIPNGIDLKFYKNINKNLSKKKLGVNFNEFIYVFTTKFLDEYIKGWHFLEKAIEICKIDSEFKKNLKDNKIQFWAVGEENGKNNKNVKFYGYIDDEKDLITILSASDVHIAPYLQDNSPYSILEAMACGTPSICFKAGGSWELIKNFYNGIIIDEISAEKLAEAILWTYKNRKIIKIMSKNCFEEAKNYSIEKIALRHDELYQSTPIVNNNLLDYKIFDFYLNSIKSQTIVINLMNKIKTRIFEIKNYNPDYIFLYGAGHLINLYIATLKNFKITPNGIIDDYEKENKINNIPIFKIEQVKENFNGKIYFIITAVKRDTYDYIKGKINKNFLNRKYKIGYLFKHV